MTRAWPTELAGGNIPVNAVALGYSDPDMTAILGADVKERILAGIPMKRIGSAEDVAAAVRFLASEEAGYITGHVLNVNGGMYMS